MLGRRPWLMVVELLGQLLWVLCWVWLCRDNRLKFWEGCCKVDWGWGCILCSWERLPATEFLYRVARRCLFSSILRICSAACRFSSACCCFSFRLFLTSSSISNSSSRTRATQFSGILMPGRHKDFQANIQMKVIVNTFQIVSTQNQMFLHRLFYLNNTCIFT